jgi:hypothetical protein
MIDVPVGNICVNDKRWKSMRSAKDGKLGRSLMCTSSSSVPQGHTISIDSTGASFGPDGWDKEEDSAHQLRDRIGQSNDLSTRQVNLAQRGEKQGTIESEA